MGEMHHETPGPDGTEQLSGQEGTTQENSGHPAWQPILDALPDDALRNMVLPKLQEWDQGVQQRFQSLHSQYEPWKPVLDSATPEVVQQALNLLQRLEDDPEFVYKSLGEAYGFTTQQVQQTAQAAGTSGQGTGEPQQPVVIDGQEYDPNDPLLRKISDLEGVLGGLQSYLQTQQEQTQQEQAIAEYNSYMENLRQDPRFKDGPYDEDVIDHMVASGISPEDAIARYQTAVKQAAGGITQQPQQQQQQAPAVMGGTAGGSGLPSGQINPATLDSKGTKQLAEAIIKRELGLS